MIALRVLTLAAVVVDIVAIKYRQMAHCMLYLECSTRLTAMMIPNVAGQSTTSVQYTYMIALAFVCFYTWRKLQIVAFLITGLALMTLEKSLVYEESLGVVSIAEALVYNFCLVIGFVALTMTLMYISNL